MSEETPKRPDAAPAEFDHGDAARRRRQARLGLALSPAERLRWLEETMEALRRLKGAARRACPMGRTAE